MKRAPLPLWILLSMGAAAAQEAPAPSAAPDPAPPPAATGSSPPSPSPSSSPYRARVRGARQGERAVSDLHIEVGKLALVPRKTAAELLTLAPGILLVNHGGAGHAAQVFLRGFDAREGQDVEFTVAGMPVNEVANAHGQGYADTHFIIPELVGALRVIEGPFDPRQGDFAVAGSADYQLGVPGEARGLRLSYQGGSFNSHRLLLLWAPGGGDERSERLGLSREGTFGAVELAQSAGFGQNRFSQRAAAHVGYEVPFGETGTARLLLLSYASRFKSAGVLRDDDLQAGRVDFFGTYDERQGGESQRHSLVGEVSGRAGPFALRQQVFLTLRSLRLRENFTGFLEDPQRVNQAPRGADPQRGDLIDQHTDELTLGARGSAQLRAQWLGRPQRLELGFYARHDRNDAAQRRLRTGTDIPYATDFDFNGATSNLAAYLDAELSPLRWLTLRGGVRGDFFLFDILNRCATVGSVYPGVPLDVACPSGDRDGPRDPSARRTATGLTVQPRVTLQVAPGGSLTGLLLSASYGHGARSADVAYFGDGDNAPFSAIRAAEGGGLYHRTFAALSGLDLTVRGAFFYTHVDQDLIFNQAAGRNTLAAGTTRIGVISAARLIGRFLDLQANLTWARATFDDTGLLVPYVPQWVLRLDGAGFGPLPRLRIDGEAVQLSGGVGFTYVAPRPLPFSEWGDAYVLLDLSLRARWRMAEVGLVVENALDRRYRLLEYNYVSDFRSRAYATLVPTRHFVAGAPLSLQGVVTLYLDRLFGRTP